MFGIYKFSFGLQFTGLVAETEEAAWAYIEKTYSKEIDGILFHANKDAFVVKKLELVEG